MSPSVEAALPERFMRKVIRRPDGTGCWDWIACATRDGYGSFGVTGGRSVLAHRFVLSTQLGRALTPSEETLHECDRPCCVNPDHLRVGTHRENIDDMLAKGRKAPPTRGEASPRAKLTDANVVAIRADRRSSRLVGIDYGITGGNVLAIRRRLTWRHVP